MAQDMAQEAPVAIDDKAREVIERGIEASFGAVAESRSIKSLRLTGKMAIPAQGLEADLELLQASGKMLMTVTIPGLGKLQEGFTGKHGWSFSELQGPALKPPAEAAQSREQADIYAAVNWEDYFSTATFVGEETIEDYNGDEKKVNALSMVTKDGERTMKVYYDAETGLQIRSDAEVVIPGGAKIPAVTLMTDFRDVDGIRVPFKTKSSLGPIEQLFTFEEVVANGEIPDSAFDVPEEIAALIEKAEADGEG